MPSNSGYGQGTSFTNVSGPSGMDVSRYLQALLGAEQRFLGNKAAMGTAKPKVNPFGKRTVAGPRMAGPGEGGRSGMQAAMERAQKAQAGAAIAEAQAATSTAPLRMVSGPGIIPGYTMDTLAMTGAQRQAFLPKSSQHQLTGTAGFGEAEDPDFMARMLRDRELARRGEGFSSLGGGRGETTQYYGGGR